MKSWESSFPGITFSHKRINADIRGMAGFRKQRREVGRACGRQALFAAGYYYPEKDPLENSLGKGLLPAWPEGYIGSITYTNEYAFAAVASDDTLSSVGIDAEAIFAPSTLQTIEKFIASDNEYELYFNSLAYHLSKEEFFSIIFSAKESIYKCFSSLARNTRGFKDVEIISVDLEKCEFEYRLLCDLRHQFVHGYVGKGFVEQQGENIFTMVQLQNLS
tara:strand:- start:373 stop:1029 length:657 start_codon:yes stop_codon:yes gene_type:complete